MNQPTSKPKQVIVIRRDLHMRRGKEIAQGSHAAMAWLSKYVKIRAVRQLGFALFGSWAVLLAGFFTTAMVTAAVAVVLLFVMAIMYDLTAAEHAWLHGSFAKICLQCESEDELLAIKTKAEMAGVRVELIADSGLTEFNGVPTNTCLAIGPDFPERIDPITGQLKLY